MLNSLWKDRKLNEEPVNRSSNMEGKTMKKRSIVTITAIIMSLLLMGCTEGEAAPVTQTINRPTDAPTEEVKPTEAPTPTEAVVETAEPTEAPTPTEEVKKSSSVIDGINFGIYNTGDPITFVSELQMNYDSLRVVVLHGGDGMYAFSGGKGIAKAEAILKDGDKFVMTLDDSLAYPGDYYFAFYTPKMYKDWELNSTTEGVVTGNLYYEDSFASIKNAKMLCQVLKIENDITMEDGELSITVSYEDDTQETITVYITKDYTL